MDLLAYIASKKVENIQLESFHEFLRGYTDMFSKNVLNNEDFTYKNLKSLIQDENIVILQGDKDSSVLIMDKKDYIQKLENMIEEGINKDTYEKMGDTTLQEFKIFCTETFTIMKTTTRFILKVTNQANYTGLRRLTSLKILRK